jgi:hypothetical protein
LVDHPETVSVGLRSSNCLCATSSEARETQWGIDVQSSNKWFGDGGIALTVGNRLLTERSADSDRQVTCHTKLRAVQGPCLLPLSFYRNVAQDYRCDCSAKSRKHKCSISSRVCGRNAAEIAVISADRSVLILRRMYIKTWTMTVYIRLPHTHERFEAVILLGNCQRNKYR